MGRYGPAPTPPAMKLRKGETRPSRVNLEAPLPRQRPPEVPPDWTEALPPDAARGMEELRRDSQYAWDLVMSEMPPGVIVAVDGLMLAAFCETWARYRQAMRAYALTGPVVVSQRGTSAVIRSPVAPLVRDALEQLRLVGRELGLSPTARAALRLDPGSSLTTLEDVLGPPPRLRVVNE
jgi:P27 family predicted phage terminase small subunit